MGIQHGTLGVEAVGKAPIFSRGQLIGEVSVGFLNVTVAGQVGKTLGELAASLVAVLALGVLRGAGPVAPSQAGRPSGSNSARSRRCCRSREAMLHGIREGVLGYDKNERIVLANDFARQLLDLYRVVGRPLRDVLPPGRLRRRGDRRYRGQHDPLILLVPAPPCECSAASPRSCRRAPSRGVGPESCCRLRPRDSPRREHAQGKDGKEGGGQLAVSCHLRPR